MKDGLGAGTGVSGIEEESNVDVLFTSANRIYFRDSAIHIRSSADGQLDITADSSLSFSGAITSDLNIDASLDIDDTTTSTNAIVDIGQAGTGKTLRLDLNSTGDPDVGLEIDDEATGNTNQTFKIASKRTGTIGLVDVEGNAAAGVEIQSAGTGKGLLLDLNATGDSGIGLEIDDEATGATSAVVQVASARTGTIGKIVAEGDAAVILELEANAAADTSQALLIDINNTGDPPVGVEIDDEATGNTNAVFKIASKRTGTVSQVMCEGDAAVGMEIDVANGGTQTALLIDHNETDGNAVGVKIDVASTGAAAFAFDLAGIATNAGIVITSTQTDIGIDTVAGVIRVQYNAGGGAATGYIPIMSTHTN